ncbi:MAG: RadC family protein, partial [bacterium]
MKPQQAREKLAQYGLPAMSDNELLTILKFKGTISDYYFSAEFKAAKELVRRYEKPEAVKIKSSRDAANVLTFLENETEENFYCIYLNRANKVISTEFISKGTATATIVNAQQIARRALELKAQAVVLSHNHPSGNLNPSDADVKVTKTIKDALKLFEIQT